MQSGAMRIANEEAVAGDGVSIHEQSKKVIHQP